jgi:hypothetical protein
VLSFPLNSFLNMVSSLDIYTQVWVLALCMHSSCLALALIIASTSIVLGGFFGQEYVSFSDHLCLPYLSYHFHPQPIPVNAGEIVRFILFTTRVVMARCHKNISLSWWFQETQAYLHPNNFYLFSVQTIKSILLD